EFDLDKLIPTFKKLDGVRFGPVKYRKLRELKDGMIAVDDMPFTKRWPYRCEEEYRIIWQSSKLASSFEIAFDLRAISQITISQRMPDQIYRAIRDSLTRTM